MKALTLTPPWGTLIAIGAKRIETRGWRTEHRGPLLIHQGRNLKPVGGEAGLMELCQTEPFRTALLQAGYTHWRNLKQGAIIAVCELIECVATSAPFAGAARPWFQATRGDQRWLVPPAEPELSFGDYGPDRYAWLLAEVRPLRKPIPARGYPGLWDYTGELGL